MSTELLSTEQLFAESSRFVPWVSFPQNIKWLAIPGVNNAQNEKEDLSGDKDSCFALIGARQRVLVSSCATPDFSEGFFFFSCRICQWMDLFILQ